jgi:hypothetical protein
MQRNGSCQFLCMRRNSKLTKYRLCSKEGREKVMWENVVQRIINAEGKCCGEMVMC